MVGASCNKPSHSAHTLVTTYRQVFAILLLNAPVDLSMQEYRHSHCMCIHNHLLGHCMNLTEILLQCPERHFVWFEKMAARPVAEADC